MPYIVLFACEDSKERKESMVETMTDMQFKKLLQMVLIILRKSDSLEEAIKEVEELASDN